MTRKISLGGIVLAATSFLNLSLHPGELALAQDKIVGYYASWKSGLLPATNVEYANLTHICVAFAYPNSNGSLGSDGGIPFSSLVQSAHNQGIKILISLGGGAMSTQFASATADSAVRSVFINNIVGFLQANSYDGVDIDWETPANTTETGQLTAFVRELRDRFNQVNTVWLITMAVPPTNYGGQHFDYPSIVDLVDWFNIMGYDFYGSWSGYAGHGSPLYQSPSDPNQAGSDSAAVMYMTVRGVPNSKLVLGIPFYGVQFSASGLYKQVAVATTSNPVHSDVVNYLASGWTYQWDDVSKVPYLLNSTSTQFVTFEDTNSIKLKGAFAVRKGLGGLMCWELAQGLTGDGKQPLLGAMAGSLKSLTLVERNKVAPPRLALYDNFPNPFNPATTIRFDLREESTVKLELMNDLGQKIIAWDLGSLEAGSHQQSIDLSRYSSGVYFYRLSVMGGNGEGPVAVKRMMLIK
ncbi:MAG: glycosyl hydrolase family 18 protein [Bacteroidota bacterium]